MYEGHFGLRTAPFHITPDPSLLMLTEVHKEALGAILYGIRARKGFVTVTGEVGVGKTTVLRSAIEQLGSSRTDIIYLVQPPGTPDELLRLLHAELVAPDIAGDGTPDRDPAVAPAAVPGTPRDISAVIADIHVRLLKQFERGHIVVVAIDEAQLLSPETLEALRLLSNFETRSAKLLQIVLVGQPELDEMLGRHELRQLAQRIAVRARIDPLGPVDSRNYIQHRLAAATDRPLRIFTAGALRTLLKAGEGYPRRLNILCDNALMNAYGHGSHTVSTKIAREAVRIFAAQERRPAARPSLIWAAAAVVAGLAVIGGAVVTLPFWRDTVPAAIAANWPLAVADGSPGETSDSAPLLREAESASQSAAPATASPEPVEPAAAAPTPEAPSTAGRGVAEAPLAEPGTKPTDAIARKLAEIAPSLARGRGRGDTAGSGTVTRTVSRGDTIAKLCAEIYGECGGEEFGRIRAANPRIRDLSRIMVGQKIAFPGVTTASAERR